MIRYLLLLTTVMGLSGCAALHHVQVGNIYNRNDVELRPIELKVSEIGIDLNDAKAISRLTMDRQSSKEVNSALAFIELFQSGPHTGAGVYSLDYIKQVNRDLRSQCENGFITGLMAIRETRKYPVIHGEIIKIKAYCATPKGDPRT